MTALLAVMALAAGCASDGKELAEGRSWQTTTTRPLPPTSAPPAAEGASGLSLASPDFEPGGETPVDATCAGANRAPRLEWTGGDSGTGGYAVSLSDQTDPDNPLLLWLVTGIPATATELDPNQLGSAVETLNDYGQLGYGNPCLETLSAGRRDLQFRLYALPLPSGIESGAPGNESWDRIASLASDSASLLMKIDALP